MVSHDEPINHSGSADVVVTGLGLTSALGNGCAAVWQRLLNGDSAIALRQPFTSLPPLPLAMAGKQPAHVQDLLDQATHEALADAGLAGPQPSMGVVIGSSRAYQGELEQLSQYYRQAIALTDGQWLKALPQQVSAHVAQQVQTTGPVLAPMAACATGLWAIAQGVQLIRLGQCSQVIVGAVEAPITPLVLAGFERMGALASTGCYPFDIAREGLVPGEGAAVLILESAAQASGKPCYGKILGAGLTNDAYHVSAPSPVYSGAISAIKHCLERSRLSSSAIDYIHAHGTATRLNDTMEAAVFQSLFPHQPAVSSTKGATGHTLGASGAIGLAVCLLALRHQQLPPNTGLMQSAVDLNLVKEPVSARVKAALCCSFGFGGQNAAVAVRTVA